jgi:hypothetical protein
MAAPLLATVNGDRIHTLFDGMPRNARLARAVGEISDRPTHSVCQSKQSGLSNLFAKITGATTVAASGCTPYSCTHCNGIPDWADCPGGACGTSGNYLVGDEPGGPSSQGDEGWANYVCNGCQCSITTCGDCGVSGDDGDIGDGGDTGDTEGD